MSNTQDEVGLVALKPLPYRKIRLPGQGFYATKSYGELFVRSKLARLATEDDAALFEPRPSPLAAAAETVKKVLTPAPKRGGKSKRGERGRYERRDMRPER